MPDGESTNPSDFAVCTLDSNKTSFTRVSPNCYDVKLKIKEAW